MLSFPPITGSPAPSPSSSGDFRTFPATRRVRTGSTYPGIMDDLGIVVSGFAQDPATLIPAISLRSAGGKVEVVWSKNGQEAIEIQVDRGNGTWVFLAIDTRPNYIDTEPFPATPAKWKYRASYTHDAQRIGQWSNIAEITVGG